MFEHCGATSRWPAAPGSFYCLPRVTPIASDVRSDRRCREENPWHYSGHWERGKRHWSEELPQGLGADIRRRSAVRHSCFSTNIEDRLPLGTHRFISTQFAREIESIGLDDYLTGPYGRRDRVGGRRAWTSCRRTVLKSELRHHGVQSRTVRLTASGRIVARLAGPHQKNRQRLIADIPALDCAGRPNRKRTSSP